MYNRVWSFFRSFFFILNFCFLCIGTNTIARAELTPRGDNSWLIVGSRSDFREAINFAQKINEKNLNTHILSTGNGWYAVSVGWVNKRTRTMLRDRLIGANQIPADSYFSSGRSFVELVWSTSGVTGRSKSEVLGATAFKRYSNNPNLSTLSIGTSFEGFVTGFKEADSFLSLRVSPSAKSAEITRLPMNTVVTVLSRSDDWYNVRLKNGWVGWAHRKYILKNNANAPKILVREDVPTDYSERGKTVEVNGLSAGELLPLRKGSGNNSEIVANLRIGTKLNVIGSKADWYLVKTDGDFEGWVSRKFVSAKVPTLGPSRPSNSTEASNAVQKSSKNFLSANDNSKNLNAAIGKRVALVLGNSTYEYASSLANPKNDANRIAEELTKLGFQVIKGLDRDKSSMENSIRDFVKILSGADVALFFYAGHAMQVGGENYLMPIDAKLEDPTALDFETINLQAILNFMDGSGGITIALLDACRDNPLSRRFAKRLTKTRSLSVGRGLASPSAGGNTLIGFSTAPGEVALDGDGDNSPFTTALLKHLPTVDLEVEAMLKKVRSEVYQLTNEQQSPWVNSGLRKEFYFAKSK